MTNRLIKIENLPAGPFQERELMEICHGDELNRMEAAIDMRQSILVECDKQLTIPFFQALRERRKKKGRQAELINLENPSADSQDSSASGQTSRSGRSGQPSSGGSPVQTLLSRLERMVPEDLSEKVVVLQHMDLMGLGADNLLDRMARDMVYLLHLNPNAVFMAFKDPEIPVPEGIRRFFSIQVSIFGIDRKHIGKVITKDEALRFGKDTVDIYKLYKHFSGLNVLRIRQLLEQIKRDCDLFPSGEQKLKEKLREMTLAASDVVLPDISFDDIGGCHEVQKQLDKDVLYFVDKLLTETTLEKTKEIEAQIPRNILFEGPPGTGKTLLAKALATRLNAAVIVVSGPEFVDKYVGESERKLREIFSRARKSAPSVVIFDEIDSIGRKRGGEEERAQHNDTVVNTLLTEMGGFRSDELVFVVGTTNHSSVLDPALLSRVHKIFHIPYPNEKGREEILGIFNKKKKLDLSKDQINFLVEETGAWINPNNWRKFGGREIEALCSAIDRETFGDPREEITLERLGELVEERIEVHFPKITFQDIGGYQKVKDQLEDDLLSMMKLAKDNRDNPDILKNIEESIPRGVIFEGPPGTGKTLFASALANALGASITVVSASELKSSYYGETEKKVRELFEQARRNSPSILVFDEMEAIMGSRGSKDEPQGRSGDTDNGLVNKILAEMDGLKSKDLVFVIGTTNLASSIDIAFKRPSRFSRIIHIPYPCEEDRRAIISVYDEKYSLGLTDKQMGIILEETENWIDANKYIRFSGDHLRSICQGIQRFYLKNQGKGIKKEDIKEEVMEKEIRGTISSMIQVPFTPISLEDDIGGYEDLKDILNEDILHMLILAKTKKDSPNEAIQIRHSIPKGVVFYGPPGTGKTLFARALATALKASIKVVSGPEIKNVWHGETERQVREIFEQARRYAPSVIVFDEFDSLAGDRRGLSGTESSVVNTILTEMDGLKENDLVFVVATTNHLDMLDEAMKRPGRFEFQIEVPYPDEEARRKIFELYNKKYDLKLTKELIDYLVFRTEMVVDITDGRRFTGDHIEAICRSLLRERYRKPDFEVNEKSLDQLVRGRTNQPERVTKDEKYIISVHEAGHAIVSKKHPKGVPPRRISIVSELAGSLGYVWHGEPENRFVRTGEDLKGQICQLLGGRAAELLVRGEQSIGCSNDLKEATRLATAMVSSLGMDEKIGPRCMPDAELRVGAGSAVEVRQSAGNPELMKLADEGIDRILKECQEKTDEILKNHKSELEELVERLLMEETIDYN